MAILHPRLARAFIDEGIIPPECNEVELTMSANGAPTLTYRAYLRPEDLPKLARAFAAMDAKVQLEAGERFAEKTETVPRPPTPEPCDDFRAWVEDPEMCGICGWPRVGHQPARGTR